MSAGRYAVFGGSGRLGRVLTALLPCDAPPRAEVDILDSDAVQKFLTSTAYRALIHLAAITNPGYAESHPLEAYRVNVSGTRNVAQIAARCGLKIFYVSTDYVFDGSDGDYHEAAPPRPANWYGATKYAGEIEIQEAGGRHAIIRTSFRPSPWQFPTAYTNVYTSADYIDVIAHELALCIQWDVDGALHVGTPVKSFFELARRRSPTVKPEECSDPHFPKRRDLNIDKWLTLRMEQQQR